MGVTPKDMVEIVAEHYQKTYELTYELWGQRNRIFLLLLGVIGAATLLNLQVAQANSLFVSWIAKTLGVTDKNSIEELQKTFPFGLLQSILLIVVFYLMVNLYHRALYVLRNYRYLGALESEIRQQLGLPAEAVSFTRESTFYWSDRPPLLGAVKWVYILLLGTLLLTFFAGRLFDDLRTGNSVFALVDLFIGTTTIVYYCAYARSSVSWDTEKEIVPGKTSKWEGPENHGKERRGSGS